MSNITVLIPTSPIKSHPDTRIIDETIASVRTHLPDSEIIITFDGIHPNYKHYEEAYNEYKNRVLWKCLHEWQNVLPIICENHEHQSGMLHTIIDEIKTPLVLYVEHDAPLTPDLPIDWQKCTDFINSGEANTIRFHFENIIPEVHEELMIGKPNNGFRKTIQWSQRPLLTTKVYLEYLLSYFPRNAQTFIEDVWYGKVLQDFNINGMHGWYLHRLWIYHPDGGIKRSYTTDGREGMPKVGEGIQCG